MPNDYLLASLNNPTLKLFLSGHAGTGKTSFAAQRLDALLRSNVDGGEIVVIAPQRSLLRPYQQILNQPDLPPGGQVDALTMGGLAKRSIDLMWPLIAEDFGFAQPDQAPTFLTLETAQYFMRRVVEPLITERLYFDGVHVPGQRLYSQLLDNLNKAALAGFPHTEVSQRLIAAWEGPSAQTITFAQVQDCINRFRDYCQAHNLLDFSLQIELFSAMLDKPKSDFKDHLFARYHHLIVDNVEEDTPVTHDLLREWIPQAQSALIVFDNGGGYRTFLGADPRSAYELREVCQEQIELTESYTQSADIQALEETIVQSSAEVDLPTRTHMQGQVANALSFGGGRFHPQMLDWIAAQITELVQQQNVEPREIVVLAPFLSDSLRFALEDRLMRHAIPTRSLRPSRALNEEAITRGLMTLTALAHSDWQISPPLADVSHTLALAIDGIDPARAHLMAERLYRVADGQASLQAFDRLKPELQERIGYEAGEKFERLRQWLERNRAVDQPLPLDHFLAKLFGEVLSQPSFGFHAKIDPGRITAQIVASARKFRQAIEPDPYSTSNTPALGRDYIRMVSDGIVAAAYTESPQAAPPNAVLLAPAYTFLLSNESVQFQFWLNAGSPAWWERLYQPLTHPYVLSRNWPAGRKWTDIDEQQTRHETLLRLIRGLLHRCQTRVYLAISTLNEQGFEERGPLLTIIQQVLREAGSTT